MVNFTFSVCRVWLIPAAVKSEKSQRFDMVRLTALTGSSGPVPASEIGQQEVSERDAHLLRVDLRDKSIQNFQHLDLEAFNLRHVGAERGDMALHILSSTITREKSVSPLRSISLTASVMAFDAALTA